VQQTIASAIASGANKPRKKIASLILIETKQTHQGFCILKLGVKRYID
jgi:hypothetical protein